MHVDKMMEELRDISEQDGTPKEVFVGSIDDLQDVIDAAFPTVGMPRREPSSTIWGLKLFEDENLPDGVIEIRNADGVALSRITGVC